MSAQELPCDRRAARHSDGYRKSGLCSAQAVLRTEQACRNPPHNNDSRDPRLRTDRHVGYTPALASAMPPTTRPAPTTSATAPATSLSWPPGRQQPGVALGEVSGLMSDKPNSTEVPLRGQRLMNLGGYPRVLRLGAGRRGARQGGSTVLKDAGHTRTHEHAAALIWHPLAMT
jgi:hypothetical protein